MDFSFTPEHNLAYYPLLGHITSEGVPFFHRWGGGGGGGGGGERDPRSNDATKFTIYIIYMSHKSQKWKGVNYTACGKFHISYSKCRYVYYKYTSLSRPVCSKQLILCQWEL